MGAGLRALVIGSTAFLTLVDLFATQAILPALAAAYGVRPAAMGLAVNAATLGMAAGSLGVALVSRRIDRRRGGVLQQQQGLLARLRGDELDALLDRKLAHVRRRGNWVRLLEVAATALFWWCPVTG